MSTSSTARRFALPAVLACALSLAACGGDSVSVSAPSVSGVAARQCAAVKAALPATLNGLKRRKTSPDAVTVAAWGDPAITLRCGVAQPGVVNAASPDYDPTGQRSQGMEDNGVCWVAVPKQGGGMVLTTVKQHTYVEVTVPSKYQESPLAALAGPVGRNDPQDPEHRFECS